MPRLKTILDENNLTRGQGFKVLRTLTRNEGEASTCILLREHNDQKEIYFLTAGTKSGADVLVDLNAFRSNGQNGLGNGDAAHTGFINAVFEDPNFVEIARYLVETHQDATFYTAGHSLGAAMSVIIGKTLWELSDKKIQPRIFGVATPMPYRHEGFQNAVGEFLNSNPSQNITCIYSSHDAVPGSTQSLGFNNLGINLELPTHFFSPLLQGNAPIAGHHFLDSGYLSEFEQLHKTVLSALKTYQGQFQPVRASLEMVNKLEHHIAENKKELEALQRFMNEKDEKTSFELQDDNGQTYSFNIPVFVTHYADALERDTNKINKRIELLKDTSNSYDNALKILEEFQQGNKTLSELEKTNQRLKNYYNRKDTQGNLLAKAMGAGAVAGAVAQGAGNIVYNVGKGIYNWFSGSSQ